jgi:predicted SnoaL-like aldol condensation-catalyzing enzyme
MTAHLPWNAHYEIGNVIAEGDLVAVHFRVVGFGPKPMVGVDILRIADGQIVEHWDVLQEEVTETVSGNPMFTPASK